MRTQSLVVYDVRVSFNKWANIGPTVHMLQVAAHRGTEAKTIIKIAEQQVKNNDPSRYGVYAEPPVYSHTVVTNL